MSDKLQKLIDSCKCSVSVDVNGYKDYYESIENALADLYDCDNDPEISDEVKAKILETGNLIIIHFYPDTPIGSYTVHHYDLNKALDESLDCLNPVS